MRTSPLAAAARRLVAVLALAGCLTAVPNGPSASAQADSPPVVSPTPQQIVRISADVAVSDQVSLVADDDVDQATVGLAVGLLQDAGVTVTEGAAPVTLRLGWLSTPGITEVLGTHDVTLPDEMPAEGYALVVDPEAIVLAGADADGLYYAVQTLRQLVDLDATGQPSIAGVAVVDHPAMPLRGSIEGFYGSPWTHAERMDQLAFYGAVKMNTYIYAPKDDPYHRDRWREPYPGEELEELRELVAQAAAHHVDFTFALSPGTSICYSRHTLEVAGQAVMTSDRQLLIAKLQAMYEIGVRTFSIPLDDISTSQWACPEDYLTYGLPGSGSAARAHVELLEAIKADFVDTHDDVAPLQTVPTDYAGLSDSTYKQVWRETLDPEIVVMWTGTDVVPTQITNEEAQIASQRYGRNVLLWDNYPVNDYDQTRGRLLLAPYDKRARGLSGHLSGIVSNPMNQAAASKVALHTIADFTWNDEAYDRERAWAAAARHLAQGDAATTEALLTFFDLNHLAPTFGTSAWQPQAPRLTARLDGFRAAWAAGEASLAIDFADAEATRIAAAGSTIRDGVTDPLLLSDLGPWLTASDLWGEAFLAYVAALQADAGGDAAGAQDHLDAARSLVAQASDVHAPPGENRWSDDRVRVGEPVLDGFLAELDELMDGS